ncbi:hypothetical protein PRIPAC_71369 [Pristionchus pacificus]|uniref:Uncharacterized protein n=1 Tax=Pristionchus pacificus TaxID=54126 RepID=A0A2A6B4L9_PRIPA|nr:hypothetical protein PRIPAC_71369 [Pristionchus pacificus]|eukprot:PDM60803.1 hypothetical protein PRIPAC_54609 [Pristionchus pacificus]
MWEFVYYSVEAKESELFNDWIDAKSNLMANYIPVIVKNTNQMSAATVLSNMDDSASLIFVVPQSEAYS